MMFIRTVLLFPLLFLSLSASSVMAATPWASDRNWELVFEDDFDG